MANLNGMLTESRGVLALHDNVTPIREDATKWKLTIRDAVLLLIGCAGMYGAQIARDSNMAGKIDRLGDKFDAAINAQTNANAEFQREIDQWRQETKLNSVNISNTQNEVAELKGLLMGAGIKGVQK